VSTGTIEKPAKAKKTKKPAEVAELPAGEVPTRPTASCGIVQLENCSEKHLRVDKLDRHPANRRPGSEAVAKLVESIGAVGLLEAVIVRPLGDRYQILSGETRWLAHRQVGAVVVRCKVVECSDAAALAVVAESNAKRTDLTTIERAQLIRQLCLSVEQGGSGFTRAEAAMVCGLESAAAASNLVKLLDAPQEWQDALVNGLIAHGQRVDVYEATVREVAKYSMCPKFQSLLLKEFKNDLEWADTRDQQLRAIAIAVGKLARATKGKHYYGYQYGEHSCVLDLTDQKLRDRLDIVELPLGANGALIECALNVAVWDELQIKEIKARGLDDESQRASRSRNRSSKKPATGKSLSPKEQAAAERAKRKEQDEQLAKWAEQWKLRLLRCSLSTSIDQASDARWILPWLIAQSARDHRCPIDELLEYAAFAGTHEFPKITAQDQGTSGASIAETILLVRGPNGGLLQQSAEATILCHRFARLVLWPSDPESDTPSLVAAGVPETVPYLDADDLRLFAEAFDVSLEQAWKNGASPVEWSAISGERALIKQLLNRHTGEQLDDLAAELGVDLDAKGKAARVEQLLAAHSIEHPRPLPKLLAGEKKRKRKGGA